MNNNQNKRGFGAMTEEERRDAQSRGGKASHESGNANEFQEGSDEAREAGRRGGQSGRENDRDSNRSDNLNG